MPVSSFSDQVIFGIYFLIRAVREGT